MKDFLFETHCHTKETSDCGHVPANRVVELYIKAGYSGVVITDHLNKWTHGNELENWEDKINTFLSGYRAAKRAAGNKLDVLLGMELTFINSSNDYLIYGLTEDIIYKYNNNDISFMQMGIRNFSSFAKDNNLMIIQAHPFRNNMTIVRPDYIDGIEIHNGNPRQTSRNDIAEIWARRHNLLTCGGSDFHQEQDLACGGLLTSQPIKTLDDLKDTIKSGSFKIFKPN